MKGCFLMFIWGLIARRVLFRDSVFSIPSLSVLWPTCLCKLVTSTRSESKRPMFPIPAAARYRARGHPIPPEPIRATLAYTNLTCPLYSIYLSNICLEYLSMSSLFSGACTFVFRNLVSSYLIFCSFSWRFWLSKVNFYSSRYSILFSLSIFCR